MISAASDSAALGRLLVGLFSLAGAVGTYLLGKRGRLTFRYTVGWLSLFSIGVLSAVLLPIVEPLAEFLGVTPAAIVAILGLMLLLAICVQLSISISGLQEQNRRLSEIVAVLKFKIGERDDPRGE